MFKHDLNSEREKTYCFHFMGYSFQLDWAGGGGSKLFYMPISSFLVQGLRARVFNVQQGIFYMHHLHGQDSTYHDLCYTNYGALAGMRNSSVVWPKDLVHHDWNGPSDPLYHD